MEERTGILTGLRTAWASYRLSVRRMAFSKFMLANLILPAIPVAIALLVWILADSGPKSINEAHDILEGFLRTIYLHFIVFFLGNIFGFAIVRQEMESHTLHYILLTPAPRWGVFAGRCMAYLTLTGAFVVGSLWLTYALLVAPGLGVKAMMTDLFVDGRAAILLKESGVLLAGLMAYGAIAMMMGSFLKSALYAVMLLGWEWTLPYLPQVMKEWTLLYYLQSLMPEKPHGFGGKLFELLGSAPNVWISLGVLAGVTAAALAVALLIFQRRECQYGESQ
jgi:ABC-type transport system involved in multi-copper enzyme maturation permease subunit